MADIWERLGGQRDEGDTPGTRQLPAHQFWALAQFTADGDLTKAQAQTILTNAGYTFDGEETTALGGILDDVIAATLDATKAERATLAREIEWITLAQQKNFLGVT